MSNDRVTKRVKEQWERFRNDPHLMNVPGTPEKMVRSLRKRYSVRDGWTRSETSDRTDLTIVGDEPTSEELLDQYLLDWESLTGITGRILRHLGILDEILTGRMFLWRNDFPLNHALSSWVVYKIYGIVIHFSGENNDKNKVFTTTRKLELDWASVISAPKQVPLLETAFLTEKQLKESRFYAEMADNLGVFQDYYTEGVVEGGVKWFLNPENVCVNQQKFMSGKSTSVGDRLEFHAYSSPSLEKVVCSTKFVGVDDVLALCVEHLVEH